MSDVSKGKLGMISQCQSQKNHVNDYLMDARIELSASCVTSTFIQYFTTMNLTYITSYFIRRCNLNAETLTCFYPLFDMYNKHA